MSSLEEKLCSMKSCESASRVLNGISLISLQTVDVLKALYRRNSIIMYDTGMGKTYIASAYIRMLLNKYPDWHFLMFVKKGQLEQTPDEMAKCIGINVAICTGDKKVAQKIMFNNEFLNYRLLLLTHDALRNTDIMKKLLEYKGFFKALVIDEAHNLNDAKSSARGAMFKALCKRFEYKLALTATPIVSAPEQLARLANILDERSYPDADILTRQLAKGQFCFENDPCFFIERTRADFGFESEIIGHSILVEAMSHQINCSGNNLMNICKGRGAVNQAKKLIDFIKEKGTDKGLVYIRHHATREWVLPFLDEAGIKYACINGETSSIERRRIMDEFNNKKELKIVITSLEESINLDCSWVMFYEFTLNVAQVIGRAYRGLYSKVLDVYFMFTADTGEWDYFQRHVLSRAVMIKEIVAKSYDAVFDVAKQGYVGEEDRYD